MLKIENVTTTGWEPAIRSMRNPKDSWKRSFIVPLEKRVSFLIDCKAGFTNKELTEKYNIIIL